MHIISHSAVPVFLASALCIVVAGRLMLLAIAQVGPLLRAVVFAAVGLVAVGAGLALIAVALFAR